jgi:hypothetical protein
MHLLYRPPLLKYDVRMDQLNILYTYKTLTEHLYLRQVQILFHDHPTSSCIPNDTTNQPTNNIATTQALQLTNTDTLLTITVFLCFIKLQYTETIFNKS